jgi:hypothetical protein
MAKTMSTQNVVNPGMGSIETEVRKLAPGGLPPVHAWNPPYSGDMDLQITRDGTWVHEGRPILRAELVRLFSTILRKDAHRYVLVTPVEMWGITVEDVPFIATDLEASGSGENQELRFETNVGDAVVASADAPIRIDLSGEEPAPYVMVRAGLEARIDRKTFYRLIDLGVEWELDGENWFGIWSHGHFFALMRASDLTN